MGFLSGILLLAALVSLGEVIRTNSAASYNGGVVIMSFFLLIVITIMSFILITMTSLKGSSAFVLCAVQLGLSLLSFIPLLMLVVFDYGIALIIFMWPMILQMIDSSMCMSRAIKLRVN